MVSTHLSKLILPDGTKMSEFALSGSAGSITGTGTSNSITKWTSGTAIGASFVKEDGLSLYPTTNINYDLGDTSHYWLNIYANKYQIGSSASSYIRNNGGNLECYILSGKKFSVIWG